ncbi:MAG: hypothetical protein ACXWQQ_13100 [Pseudobdellovibrio sp.]
MITSIESRLWLAVHLLYSNASQAFDVYQAVVLQSEHAIANNDVNVVFSRLFQVYEKIPAIGSSLAFYEFEFEEIDQWKIIYKNSQKTQLIIFIGVLIFELKIGEIAQVVKLAPEKAQFLFQQIFKKLASTSQKLKYNEQLEFKKQNDNKISYLFTYENLVDFCLGQLSEEDSEKVKAGLKIYPMLQIAKEEYSRIISQIQNLKVQKERAVISSDMKPNLKIVNNEVTAGQYSKGLTKNQVRGLSGAAVLIGIIILVPTVNYLRNLKSDDKTIVLHEIAKPQPIKEPVATVAAASATTVVSATTAAIPTPTTSTTTVAVNDNAKKESPPVPPPKPVIAQNTPPPTPPPQVKEVPKEAQSEGGLYRGTLNVTNLAEINEKIKEKMNSMGAVKAGEVELGWMKSSQMAYYHYTLPEKNMAEVEQYLKQLGSLQLKFEKHPRKVPAGTRRFIIEVKQN